LRRFKGGNGFIKLVATFHFFFALFISEERDPVLLSNQGERTSALIAIDK
jgi:hypothetical protein